MAALDWWVIGLYMLGMIAMSVYLGRGQEDEADYYVGGRNLPWWAVGISTMATQSSAISFISIPAFVALQKGGGLKVLQYEFAVPLAMVFIMVLLVPLFRRLELISVYEYLEHRFDRPTRLLLSLVFLVSRGVATGVGLYAIAIVLSVVLDVSLAGTIVLIAVITLVYDMIGGMKAVVYSDVVQMLVIVAGLALSCWYAAGLAGGWDQAVQALTPDRLVGVDFRHNGITDGEQTNFWALVLGGFFLYASYYGCDQSQTQRQLSAPTLADTRRSLIFNGLCRFPLVASYAVMGIFVGGALAASPEFQQLLEGYRGAGGGDDYMVPVFIKHYLPSGLRAVVFAAILAAAMSSLDSAINSLSAATLRDFLEGPMEGSPPRVFLWTGRFITGLWGFFAMGTALAVANIKDPGTVLVLINKVGSLFYGPILAAFLLGVTSRRANGAGTRLGLVAGVLANGALALFAPTVSWWWWNPFGCAVTMLTGLAASGLRPPPSEAQLEGHLALDAGMAERERPWLPSYAVLGLYFLGLVAFALMAGHLLRAL